MQGAAVRDDLPVDRGARAHLVLERGHLLVGDDRVVRAREDEDRGLHVGDVGGLVHHQVAVQRDRGLDVGARAGDLERGAAAEAVAHDGDARRVDVGFGRQAVDAGLHAGAHEREVGVEGARHLAGLGRAGAHVAAVDVGGERDVAEAREHLDARGHVPADAEPVMDHEHGRASSALRGVTGEQALELGAVVVVKHGAHPDVGARGQRHALRELGEGRRPHGGRCGVGHAHASTAVPKRAGSVARWIPRSSSTDRVKRPCSSRPGACASVTPMRSTG